MACADSFCVLTGFRGSALRQLNRDEQKRSVPDRFRIDEWYDFCRANVLTNDARDPQSIRYNAVQKCRAGYKPKAIQKMGWAGLEPAANALKGRCSTIELPTPGNFSLSSLLSESQPTAKAFGAALPMSYRLAGERFSNLI